MQLPKLTLLTLTLLAGTAGAETCAGYPGMCIDQTYLMTPKVGSANDVIQSTTNPGADHNCLADPHRLDCGGFRVNLEPSHMGFDDPIVNPSATATPFMSHLHIFTGLTGVNWETDITINPQDAVPLANSTSNGGAINRTAYWVPSMLDVRTGRPLVPTFNLAYYKASQQRPEEIQHFPEHLRFIAGDATRTTSTSQPSSGVISFQCKTNGPNSVGTTNSLLGMKDCPVGGEIWQLIEFGQCLSVDGILPETGTFSGALVGWRAQASKESWMVFRSTTNNSDVAAITVSGGGGAAAPVVTKELSGSSTKFRTERNVIQFVPLTAGQWVEVAGLRYTSTGDSTAEEIVLSFSGGSPNVDSADHKSHHAKVGGAAGTGNCPATHPYPIPHIRYTFAYAITDAEFTQNIRLSCDTYKGEAGNCSHGDWRYGWKDARHKAWNNGCNRNGLDSTNLQCNRDENNNEDPAPYDKYGLVPN